jgi:hypothetical protein
MYYSCMIKPGCHKLQHITVCITTLVVSWLQHLPFKLGDPGSILGQTSTQGESATFTLTSVISDKGVKIVGTSDPVSIGQYSV